MDTGAPAAEDGVRAFADPCSVDLEGVDVAPLADFLPDVDGWYRVKSVVSSEPGDPGAVMELKTVASQLTRSGDGVIRESADLTRSFTVSETIASASQWATENSVDLVFAETVQGRVRPGVSYAISNPASEPVFVGDCATALKQDPIKSRMGEAEARRFLSGLVALNRAELELYVGSAYSADQPPPEKPKTLNSSSSDPADLEGLDSITIVIDPPAAWREGYICPRSSSGMGACIDLSYRSGPQRTEIWFEEPEIQLEYREDLDRAPTNLGSALIDQTAPHSLELWVLYGVDSAGGPGSDATVRFLDSAPRSEVRQSAELSKKFGLTTDHGNLVEDEVEGE